MHFSCSCVSFVWFALLKTKLLIQSLAKSGLKIVSLVKNVKIAELQELFLYTPLLPESGFNFKLGCDSDQVFSQKFFMERYRRGLDF